MDLLVVAIALLANHDTRLGIIAHPGESDVIATAADADARFVDESTLRSRSASEWQHWYQLCSR